MTFDRHPRVEVVNVDHLGELVKFDYGGAGRRPSGRGDARRELARETGQRNDLRATCGDLAAMLRRPAARRCIATNLQTPARPISTHLTDTHAADANLADVGQAIPTPPVAVLLAEHPGLAVETRVGGSVDAVG